MTLQDRLRIAREEAGLYQKELAEVLGMPMRTYAAYERGERDLSTAVLLDICKALRISADWLLGTSDEKNMSSSTTLGSENDIYQALSELSNRELKELRVYIEFLNFRRGRLDK